MVGEVVELQQSSQTLKKTKDITFNNNTSFEHHAFVFSSPPILCMTIYRPPKHHPCFISEFYTQLTIGF